MAVPRLHLAVQYASRDAAPARAQTRRWVAASLSVISRTHGASIVSATLTFRYVDEAEGRALNRTYRGRDYATNVLTFRFDEGTAAREGGHVEADVVICVPVVVAEARTQHKALATHCAHLVVHGVLHACGYDHEADGDAEAMEALERQVLRRFGIVDPYRVLER